MPSAFLQWLYADAADVPQTGYEVSRNSDPMSPKFTRPRNSASGSYVSSRGPRNEQRPRHDVAAARATRGRERDHALGKDRAGRRARRAGTAGGGGMTRK